MNQYERIADLAERAKGGDRDAGAELLTIAVAASQRCAALRVPPVAPVFNMPSGPPAPSPRPPRTPAAPPTPTVHDWDRMTWPERAQLRTRDEKLYTALRDQHTAGLHLVPPPGKRYEQLSNQERAFLARHDIDRFNATRNDWIRRGQPLGDDAA